MSPILTTFRDMHPFSLQNETALITGGGSSLGMPSAMVQSGAKVVRVNAIAPGWIDSVMLRQALDGGASIGF